MKHETNRSEKKSWNLFLMLALFLCVAFGLVALTYSWLTDSEDDVLPTDEFTTYEEASIGDFSYDFEYSFNGTNGSSVSSAQGGILVDYGTYANENDKPANHITKLRFQLTQHGTVKSTARVKFAYQWFNTQTLTTAQANEEPSTVRNAMQGPAITLTPTVTGSWISGQDGYYYYQDQTTSSYVLTSESTVPICTGFSSVSVPADYTGQLRVIALLDGVQFNRYREVWNLTTEQPSG